MNGWTKRKWVKALRSGEYQQAQGTLFIDEKGEVTAHCCLAVLLAECRPAAFDGRTPGFWPEDNPHVIVGDDQDEGKIADDLAVLFDLDQNSQDTLAEMNDEGSDFDTIADWIETNL